MNPNEIPFTEARPTEEGAYWWKQTERTGARVFHVYMHTPFGLCVDMNSCACRITQLEGLWSCKLIPSTALDSLRNAYQREDNEIQQICGKALDYPWFKDDLKNFPDATEADGVCVGEHVAASIAQELADKFTEQKTALDEAKMRIEELEACLHNIKAYCQDDIMYNKMDIDTILRLAKLALKL